MKIQIINGPNLNMLGIREPSIYGKETYASLLEKIKDHCIAKNVEVNFFQSNHEGDLVDCIQQCLGIYDAIVINPGAYTHTSIALLDAAKAVNLPMIEVHISKLEDREDFRQCSYIRKACIKTITGHGTNGYLEAIDFLLEYVKTQNTTFEVFKSRACGVIKAPPSKSMAHRYLISAALAQGKSIIKNIALSEDIKATLSCLTEIGVSYTFENGTIIIDGIGKTWEESKNKALKNFIFHCHESGSTLRFFIPLAMFFGYPSTFLGTQKLLSRPLSVYQEIAVQDRIKFELSTDKLNIHGKLNPGFFKIPGNISSQFVTGLLFVLPLLKTDSIISLIAPIESKSYINMTLQVLNQFGITAFWQKENEIFVAGNQTYQSGIFEVEGDFSNTVFFDVYNYLGGKVTIQGLNPVSLQGDKIYQEYLEKLDKGFATIDLSDCPDLGPMLIAFAALKYGAEFKGSARLDMKESNRREAMRLELKKFGVQVDIKGDNLCVKKTNFYPPQEVLFGHNDHRIVMALVVLLSLTGGRITGCQAVKKSLPDYFERIKNLGVKILPVDLK